MDPFQVETRREYARKTMRKVALKRLFKAIVAIIVTFILTEFIEKYDMNSKIIWIIDVILVAYIFFSLFDIVISFIYLLFPKLFMRPIDNVEEVYQEPKQVFPSGKKVDRIANGTNFAIGDLARATVCFFFSALSIADNLRGDKNLRYLLALIGILSLLLAMLNMFVITDDEKVDRSAEMLAKIRHKRRMMLLFVILIELILCTLLILHMKEI